MATLNDAVRRINDRLNELAQQLIAGSWMDDERSAEWHGMHVKRYLAHIEGLKAALQIIQDLQRDT